MSHTWNDFYEGQDPPLGPQLPLTSGQQSQLVSGVLPSGESNFLDLEQDRQKYQGSGINRLYDYEKEASGSGLVATYPQDQHFSVANSFEDDKPSGLADREYESGIFHYNGIGYQNPPAADQFGNVANSVQQDRSGSDFGSGYFTPSGFDVRFQKYIRPEEIPSLSEPPRPDWAFRVMDSYIHHKTWPGVNPKVIQIRFLDDAAPVLEYNRYGIYQPNLNGYYNAQFRS